MSNIILELKEKIAGKGLKIVFPEAHDERILEAAVKLGNEGIIQPVLIGDVKNIPSKYDVSKCEIVNPKEYKDFDKMVESFVERRKGKSTVEEAKELLLTENYFGTMLVYMGN